MDAKYFVVPLMVLSVFFLPGCTKVDSSDIKTSGIYAKYTAVDDGTSVTAEAGFSTGPYSTDSIRLTSGDVAYATFSAQTKQMAEDHTTLGGYTYTAVFNTSGATQQVTIDLQRQNETSAPNSYVTLPAAFSVSSPTGGTTYSIAGGGPITVNWAPTASSSMKVRFSGTCQVSSGSTLAVSATYSVSTDTGSYSKDLNVMLGEMTANTSPPVSITSCANMAVVVTRINNGVVDSNFGQGGYFTGTEKRSTYIVINP